MILSRILIQALPKKHYDLEAGTISHDCPEVYIKNAMAVYAGRAMCYVKNEWYKKLAAKLERIKSGDLNLDDYIKEVNHKVAEYDDSRKN